MMDVREIAEAAGRTPETVRRWVWSGRLHAERRGNRLLVARQAVDDLLRGRPDSSDASGRSVPVGASLGAWSALVAQQRRTGALEGQVSLDSAADLVLDDRASRQVG